MTYDETSDKLAGPIGLLKQYVRALYWFSLLTNFNQICITDRSRNCRRWDLLYELKLDVYLDISVRADATQVFGGRALTMTGMGKIIEGVRFFHIILVSTCINVFIIDCSTIAPRALMQVSGFSGLVLVQI